ncbi:MAG: hypothetical protein QOC95_1848 [Thermoleophilaceae bacterium]|jgi:hypothetical protein|nr:hypothetical protein [Thermoleophilaceae bacterium]
MQPMRRWLVPAAIVLAAWAVVAPVRAGTSSPTLVTGNNLLVNGGAESGAAGASVTDPPAPPPGWTVTGSFSQARYGTGDFPSAADSKAAGGGQQFFAGGPGGGSVSSATQTIDVSADAGSIDAGGVFSHLTAYVGGFGLQRDYGVVDAFYLDAAGKGLGQMRVGPVTVDDRGGLPVAGFEGYGHTELLPRAGRQLVPPGTRAISVVLTSTRLDGTYGDAYFDNIGLSLERRTAALEPPWLAHTLLASSIRGRVSTKQPGDRRWRRLTGTRHMLIGTRFDVTNGTVRITTAANRLGEMQSGDFNGGRFTVTQRDAPRPFTVLTLQGGNLGACATGAGAGAARARRRHLFGRSGGHFRSRGRNSSATTRGTSWETEDTCAGTATNVMLGKIDVHDFARDAVVPIARGVQPDRTEHDPPPPPPCAAEPCLPPPLAASPPGRRAGSSYVASGGRRGR